MREGVADLFKAKIAAFRNPYGARQDIRRILEDSGHFFVAFDEELITLELHPVGFLNSLASLNAQHYILRVPCRLRTGNGCHW